MGKIVGWGGADSEEPIRSADVDERERALEADELREGEALVDGEIVSVDELFDDEVVIPEDEGLARATEKRERLDYFRILSKVLGVAQRQAEIARSRNGRLRSPNLNVLIAFIDERASGQD